MQRIHTLFRCIASKNNITSISIITARPISITRVIQTKKDQYANLSIYESLKKLENQKICFHVEKRALHNTNSTEQQIMDKKLKKQVFNQMNQNPMQILSKLDSKSKNDFIEFLKKIRCHCKCQS